LFEDLEDPFVFPEFGVEECCGKKAHLATLGRDGEVSAALSAIRQTANPGTDLFVIGASDRRMEWTAEWVDPDEPNTYPKFPSRCERRFSYAGQAPCLRYESLFTTYQGGNTEDRDCFALQLPGYIYSTECTAFQRFVFEYDCDVCDPDYVQFGGHQYGVVVSGRPFIEAVLHSEGGRAHKCCDKEPKLVTIESAAENAFVAALLQDVDEAWIGLSDLAFEGTYEWGLSGAVLANASYTNWAAGEPDDGGPRWRATEDCVVMRRADGKWYDTDCSFSKSYVIEFDCDS
jgi:Lectin C-type domain